MNKDFQNKQFFKKKLFMRLLCAKQSLLFKYCLTCWLYTSFAFVTLLLCRTVTFAFATKSVVALFTWSTSAVVSKRTYTSLLYNTIQELLETSLYKNNFCFNNHKSYHLLFFLTDNHLICRVESLQIFISRYWKYLMKTN